MGQLKDKLGFWHGSTAYGGEYTLKCPPDTFVWGGALTEVSISCPKSGQWSKHQPNCISPSGQAFDAEVRTFRFWTFVALALLCVCCAATAAGLTLGVATLEPFKLKVILTTDPQHCKSETEKKSLAHMQLCAAKVSTVVTGDHLLMVALMLFNTLANEALPICLDQVAPALLSVLLSVTVVLVFGEILPSAVCTGPSQHSIAATFVPVVRCLQFAFSPVAKPVTWLLNYLVPTGNPNIKYSRDQLRGVLHLHGHKQNSEASEDLRCECGNYFMPDAIFCRKCGKKISRSRSGKVAPLESPDQSPVTRLVSSGSFASESTSTSTSVIAPAELRLLTSILDLQMLELKKFNYAKLTECVLAKRSESAVDVVARGAFGKKPRAILVVSDAHDVSEETLPLSAVCCILRPRSLLRFGKEPLEQHSGRKTPLTVEDDLFMFEVLHELDSEQSDFALVVRHVRSVQEVEGVVLKPDILAFMFSGEPTENSTQSPVHMPRGSVRPRRRGINRKLTSVSLRESQSQSYLAIPRTISGQSIAGRMAADNADQV